MPLLGMMTDYFVLLKEYQSNSTFYAIKGYTDKLLPKRLTFLKTENKYPYSFNENGTFSSGKYNMGANSTLSEIYGLPQQQSASPLVKLDFRDIMKYLFKLFAVPHPKLNCAACESFFSYLVKFLTTQNVKITAELVGLNREDDGHPNWMNRTQYFRAQAFYGIGSVMIRALYDGTNLKMMDYQGNGTYNIVYQITDTKVVRIYISPLDKYDEFDGKTQDYEYLNNVYEIYNALTDLIRPLKSFIKIEACNANDFIIPMKTGMVPHNKVYTFRLILPKYKKFDEMLYRKRIENGEVLGDLSDILDDSITLFNKNYVYVDYKPENTLLDNVTYKLLIGDIDVEKIGNDLGGAARFIRNDERRISYLKPNHQYLSYSLGKFLIFIIDLFNTYNNAYNTDEFILSQLVTNGKHVVLSLIHHKTLYNPPFNINVFEYVYYILYLVETYIEQYAKHRELKEVDEILTSLDGKVEDIISTYETSFYSESDKERIIKELRSQFILTNDLCKNKTKRRIS
jgi:hypothetical protein